MRAIELIGQVDEQHQLRVEMPEEVPPGLVKVIVEVEDEDELAWSRGIAEAWAADWSDPRDDIYTLEDGKPYDATR